MKLILDLQIISDMTTKMIHLLSFYSCFLWEFLGSLLVGTRNYNCRVQVLSLVGELRSLKPQGTDKNKKNKG